MDDRARAPIRVLVTDDEVDVRDAYRQILAGPAVDGGLERLQRLQARLFHDSSTRPGRQPAASQTRLVTVAQAVAHQAEDLGAALRVVAGVVRAARIPVETCDRHRLGEHCLAERSPGQGCRVEAGKRVKGVALHIGARHGGIEKAQIEGGVVTHQDSAPAPVGAHRVTDFAEHSLQRIALGQRRAQRMVRIDAGDRQRRRIQARSREGLYVVAVGFAAAQCAAVVHVDERRGDLQQGIGRGMKATALNIDHHRQIAAETPRHERGTGCARGCRFRS